LLTSGYNIKSAIKRWRLWKMAAVVVPVVVVVVVVLAAATFS